MSNVIRHPWNLPRLTDRRRQRHEKGTDKCLRKWRFALVVAWERAGLSNWPTNEPTQYTIFTMFPSQTVQWGKHIIKYEAEESIWRHVSCILLRLLFGFNLSYSVDRLSGTIALEKKTVGLSMVPPRTYPVSIPPSYHPTIHGYRRDALCRFADAQKPSSGSAGCSRVAS